MSESDRDILATINTWVWSGLHTPEEVDEMIDDVLDDDADEDTLRAAVGPEFERKLAAEAAWPSRTDCDRLDDAFDELDSSGIVALDNAGYTMSDGVSDVAEVLDERGRDGFIGYCFYHGQDLERAVRGEGLTLAFGDLDDDSAKKTEIGRRVKAVLEKHGLTVEWNGNPESRLNLPRFDWKRRSPGC